MGLHDTRYFFEHIIMPGLFYGQPNTLMEILEKDSKSLYELWQSTCKGQHIDDPYKEEDFSVTAFQVSRDVKGFEITLPVPEEAPLCYAFYFVCHKDDEKCTCYTVEKTEHGGACFCN